MVDGKMPTSSSPHLSIKRYTIMSPLPSPQRYTDWQQKFGHHLGKRVVLLTGETSVDLRLLRDVSEPLQGCATPASCRLLSVFLWSMNRSLLPTTTAS